MSARCAALAMCAIVIVAPLHTARAQTPAPSPPAAYCDAFVEDVVVLPDGRRAVVGVATFGEPGSATGVVRLFAGERAFDVPFAQLTVPKVYAETARPFAPLVVNLPPHTIVDAAIVSALGEPAAPCPPADPWVRPLGLNGGPVADALRGRWSDLARNAPAVDAPPSVALPPAPCRETFSRARAAFRPPVEAARRGAFFVDVATDGTARADPYVSTGDRGTDATVAQRLSDGTWVPARVRCVDVPAAFAVVFGAFSILDARVTTTTWSVHR